jgi:hypothetical protein
MKDVVLDVTLESFSSGMRSEYNARAEPGTIYYMRTRIVAQHTSGCTCMRETTSLFVERSLTYQSFHIVK